MKEEEIENLLICIRDGSIPESEDGVLVTIATSDLYFWDYQLGNPVFAGPIHLYAYHAHVYLRKDSNCNAEAKNIVEELREQVLNTM